MRFCSYVSSVYMKVKCMFRLSSILGVKWKENDDLMLLFVVFDIFRNERMNVYKRCQIYFL